MGWWLVSFFCLAWKTYTIPQEWTVGVELLRHTMGAVRAPPCETARDPH